VLVSAALAADLATLSAALVDAADEDVDLQELLRHFERDAKLAIRSYVGMSISIGTGPGAYRLTWIDENVDANDIATSLRFPVSGLSNVHPSTVTMYAGRPGALVDLAADLSWILNVAADAVVLDDDTTVSGKDEEHSLEALSIMNQAIGMLIDHGFAPEEALPELVDRAELAGITALAVAAALVQSKL
jgi:hypothetical protein